MSIIRTNPINLAVDTSLYASGDALGEKNSVTSVPERGTIVGVFAVDRDSEDANFDIVLFKQDITGTSDNAAFDPTDAELDTCIGVITVNRWHTFNDNSVGMEAVNARVIGYDVPGGTIFFQCVTRATPTYTATTDVRLSFLIEIGGR